MSSGPATGGPMMHPGGSMLPPMPGQPQGYSNGPTSNGPQGPYSGHPNAGGQPLHSQQQMGQPGSGQPQPGPGMHPGQPSSGGGQPQAGPGQPYGGQPQQPGPGPGQPYGHGGQPGAPPGAGQSYGGGRPGGPQGQPYGGQPQGGRPPGPGYGAQPHPQGPSGEGAPNQPGTFDTKHMMSALPSVSNGPSSLPPGARMLQPMPGQPQGYSNGPTSHAAPGQPYGGQPGIPPGPGQTYGGQPGVPPPPGTGQPYGGQPRMPPPPGPGQPYGGQPGMPPPPGQQYNGQPGMPPPPGQQYNGQPGMPPPPGPGQPYGGQPGMPPPPGQQYSGQPGMPPPPGQQYSGQPGMPPPPGQPYGGQPGIPSGPMYRPPGPGYAGQPLPQGPAGPGCNYGMQPPGGNMGAPVSQARKLDPEQMPSAIGVMEEDQQNRSGVFQTNQRGLLPPLVTTNFTVEDHGNASPRFVRSTMYSVPAQPDMLKQTAVPFAIVVNPLANPGDGEKHLTCVDLGPTGPVRCIRCKAYVSPLMQFIDGGRRFQCLLCKATTEVPPEYFQHLDHTGNRVDKWERPELWKGSYEFVATMEYCRNNVLPKEPGYIFAIDVSYSNVKSGLVNLFCSNIASLLESLPSHTPVGFITYNSKVHFYNIDPNLAQPQMITVPDVADMFMPILDGFMVPRGEAGPSIETLMAQIPALFSDTKETEAVLGPAIQAGMEALKASDRVGKVLVFHSSLPTSDVAPGKLKNREGDRKLLGTDKEKTVLTPQTTYYNNLAQDCVGNGVSVDLYLFNNAYIDVATIGQVARVTGGSVNKYTYFQADIDGARVLGELAIHLGRTTGFDCVMRVRTSTGVRPTDFFGHFYMSNTTDVEIAALDSHKGIAVEIKHDDKLTDEEGVYMQVALLYTTIFGQRRLRIHNLALNTCAQMADLYRNCELDTIINFLAKQAISKSMESSPQAIKEGIIQRSAQMLATYRKHCANPSMPGQLILPECLKLLPLFVNCILRSDAISGSQELTPDDRSWTMYTMMTMGIESSVHYFYPKLTAIAGPGVDPDNLTPIRCTQEKLRDDSAYILENGIYIFLWIGSTISPEWVQSIFGVANVAQVNAETITELPDHITSDESLRLKAHIRKLRHDRHRHMRLTIIRQRDKLEIVMKKFLVEDRSSEGHSSYVDFLCHMHKEIRALLNQ